MIAKLYFKSLLVLIGYILCLSNFSYSLEKTVKTPLVEYSFLDRRIYIFPNEGFDGAGIPAILERHPHPENVTSVAISYNRGKHYDYPQSEPILEYIAAHFNNLTEITWWSLRVDNQALLNSAFHFPKLEEFWASLVGETLDDGGKILALSMPNLKALYIDDGKWSDSALESFILSCPQLIKLCDWNGSYSTIPPVGASLLTDRSLHAIANYGNNIRYLSLSGAHFTWAGLFPLLLAGPAEVRLFRNQFDFPIQDIRMLRNFRNFNLMWSVENGPAKGVPDLPPPPTDDD